MKAVYYQRGETIDFVNNTAADIAANDVVTLTSRIGIAATAIPVGHKGAVNVMGVYALPAETTVAFTVGQKVYLANDTLTATEGVVFAGYVVEPKALATATAFVKID